ncbi:hypothetical protein ANCDUO_07105 [Ancylostoma duodenale]|uniref:Uncharacterized protein n=1 Tax=Ancylostoma duodenale TaxID=51022 RepID=A0A0C2GZQ0_9BILA|nr:hypothetical protein ANCDUO_07105 [Ancylostoma duodenale]
MQTTCVMIQEWDKNARKAIRRRQAFENNIGAPGVPGNPNFSPAVPQRFAPSAQGCMNIQCICPYMGEENKENEAPSKGIQTVERAEEIGQPYKEN